MAMTQPVAGGLAGVGAVLRARGLDQFSRRLAAVPVVKEVVLRLARPDERVRWDECMDAQHYLGFKQFAGRGLRYIAEWQGRWLALLGWQTGAFQCRPRDKWLGWHPSVQFKRLHLIGNNTRFLVLPRGAGVKNLASRVLGLNLQRLSADWEAAWGHRLELAETFVDPQKNRGTCYRAANWIKLGLSKGYARSNGRFTAKHGQKKVMLVYPLRKGARERLADPQERAEWQCPAVKVSYGQDDLRALRGLLDEVEDPRGRHGKRHLLGAVLALLVLARLAGYVGGRQTEAFCKTLKQRELKALGCRWDAVGKVYVAPSDTTFQRVMAHTDPAALERVAQRWAQPRVERPRALAADGKRIRGANRLTAEGLHWETVTLVDHATGVPVASRSYREEGGEQWAMRAILEETDVRDVTLTLDAGHAGFDLERALVEQHGADYVLRIKGNCKRTFATLTGTDWEAGAERTHAEQRWERTHTRSWERRSIAVFTPAPQLLSFRHARQAFRITHESCRKLGGKVTVTHSYGISSLPAERATARDLLALMRGHWRVESRNHYSRDVTYGEDRSRVRTGHGPANSAALNNLALALILSRPRGETVPQAQIHYNGNRDEALERLLLPN